MFLLHKWLFRQLTAKLILTILTLLLLSITLISSLYYWSSRTIIGENVRASTTQSAKQSADYLSLILTVGANMGQQIFRDAQIQEVIREEAAGPGSVDRKFNHKAIVDDILNNIIYTSSFVQSVYLLKQEGASWGSGTFNQSKVTRYTLNEHAWYRNVVGGSVDELWQPLQYDPFSGGGENNALALTYVKPLRNLETGQALGAIVVNLSGSKVLEAIERTRLGDTGRFTVVNEEGTIMIGSDRSEWDQPLAEPVLRQAVNAVRSGEAEFEREIDGVRTYVVVRKMDNGWTIVGTVPVREIIGDIQNLQEQIWIYGLLILLGGSLTGLLFSRKITSPLKLLMRQMSQIERSNFQAVTEVTSQDEIGQLSRKFNQMVGQIKMLIGQINEVEARKREAEIRALRHQINPHFLYNTLSSIRWMVRFNKTDGAYNGISALVRLMEASMEKQGVFSTIRDELELLDKYMVIQRYRYGEHIRLHVDCDPRLLDKGIPRMLMQPIVENAVFHGIAPKDGGGTIHIAIAAQYPSTPPNLEEPEERITITIRDDGLGMSEQKADELFLSERSGSTGLFGIGLRHVQETIQLYYGPDSGVAIESTPGKGTLIRLELIMKVGERYAV